MTTKLQKAKRFVAGVAKSAKAMKSKAVSKQPGYVRPSRRPGYVKPGAAAKVQSVSAPPKHSAPPAPKASAAEMHVMLDNLKHVMRHLPDAVQNEAFALWSKIKQAI